MKNSEILRKAKARISDRNGACDEHEHTYICHAIAAVQGIPAYDCETLPIHRDKRKN